MNQKPRIIKVSKLFNNVKYEVPIYQRNYAWKAEQIEQLIEDIYTSEGMYFLGNLIVNQKELDTYEVIDGQQRLTTLFLLERYLEMGILEDSLHFEAREKSNRTLSIIGKKESESLLDELKSDELNDGYKIIKDYFDNNRIKRNEFIAKLNSVLLIRIQVPKDIDLNHYFEIMNTRGEQLEFHEIAKAKLLSKLSTKEDKKVGALIWESCSKMDSYVQMNFNSKIRGKIFSNDWTSLDEAVDSFDEVKGRVSIGEDDNINEDSKTLFEILEFSKPTKYRESKDEEENERFESIISYPNFILQVNQAISKLEENESMLDDRNFLKNIEKNWKSEDAAKSFLYNLLRCRVLFDKYILKREFAKDYKDTGKWSLQRLESYRDNKSTSLKPKYVGTFGDDNDNSNKQIRTLQSCLRITYTSPKTMHWISLVLRSLINNESSNILSILEKYCNDKVNNSNYEYSKGFGLERIVFTYLDYILYRDGYYYKDKEIISPLKDDWQFQFRNSIEHFYPQNPIETEDSIRLEDDDLNSFGNLALITVSGNSKFSNLPPAGKINSYNNVINQSLKLKIMKEMLVGNDNVWNKEILDIHKREMFDILHKQVL